MSRLNFFNSIEDLSNNYNTIDAYNSELVELFYIRNPHFKKNSKESEPALNEFINNSSIESIWVEYPWKNLAIRTVKEDLYFELRTARNKFLITPEEQKKYRELRLGIAGLSVGSSILEALCRSGGPKIFKIADFDIVEVSNLNRIKANITDFGLSKALVASRRVWEIDPFADIDIWDKGVNQDNLKDFLINDKLDIFVDAMDSIDLKILSRFLCREYGIPVLMATDVGDGVIIDVERYDENKNLSIFNGVVDEDILKNIQDLSPKEWLSIASKLVGPDQPMRMKESIMEMGKTISGLPQLGTSAMLAGSVISYISRRIANKQNMPSGKYYISLEKLLDPDFNTEKLIDERKNVDDMFSKLFT